MTKFRLGDVATTCADLAQVAVAAASMVTGQPYDVAHKRFDIPGYENSDFRGPHRPEELLPSGVTIDYIS